LPSFQSGCEFILNGIKANKRFKLRGFVLVGYNFSFELLEDQMMVMVKGWFCTCACFKVTALSLNCLLKGAVLVQEETRGIEG